MLDANVGFNGDLNFNFKGRENISSEMRKEEIYEQLYKPLLLIDSCWRRHAEEVKPLLDKSANCVALSKEFFYEMYNEIISYNANFVKCLSLGKILPKYKQFSAELVQCAIFLEKHLDDDVADKAFFKNAIRIHEICNKILDMLRYDFGFQV